MLVCGVVFYWFTWYRFTRQQYTFDKSIWDLTGRTVVYKNRSGSLFNGWGNFASNNNLPWMYIGAFAGWEATGNNDVYMILNDKSGARMVKTRIIVEQGANGTDYRVDNLSQLPYKDVEKLGLIYNYGKDKFIKDIHKGDTVAVVISWDDYSAVVDDKGFYQTSQVIIRRFNGKNDL